MALATGTFRAQQAQQAKTVAWHPSQPSAGWRWPLAHSAVGRPWQSGSTLPAAGASGAGGSAAGSDRAEQGSSKHLINPITAAAHGPATETRTDLPPHSWLSCVSQPGLNMDWPAPAASISLPVSIFWFRSYSSCEMRSGSSQAQGRAEQGLSRERKAAELAAAAAAPGCWATAGGHRAFHMAHCRLRCQHKGAQQRQGRQEGASPTFSSLAARTSTRRGAAAWRCDAEEGPRVARRPAAGAALARRVEHCIAQCRAPGLVGKTPDYRRERQRCAKRR